MPVQELQTYLGGRFLTMDQLASMTVLTESAVHALINAGALPLPSYTIWPNGGFASPIGGHHGPAPQGQPQHFYASAAVWPARRARLLAADAEEIAEAFRTEFCGQFCEALAAEPLGPLGYPAAYKDGRLDTQQAEAAANAEWADWINGGYGVCLRYWDAHHAITKTCQRGLILALTEEGQAGTLPKETLDKLLAAMQALEAVMLPFAPHQRPHGTPGLWIDRMLARFDLGRTILTEPAPSAMPDRICA